MCVDGNHRKVVLCDELGVKHLTAILVNAIDKDGIEMTLEEFKIIQAGRNFLINEKNICIVLFFKY